MTDLYKRLSLLKENLDYLNGCSLNSPEDLCLLSLSLCEANECFLEDYNLIRQTHQPALVQLADANRTGIVSEKIFKLSCAVDLVLAQHASVIPKFHRKLQIIKEHEHNESNQ